MPGGRLVALRQHKVLRNTYMLLSLTLLFSAGAATFTAALNLPAPGILLTLVGYFGLLFLQPFMMITVLSKTYSGLTFIIKTVFYQSV